MISKDLQTRRDMERIIKACIVKSFASSLQLQTTNQRCPLDLEKAVLPQPGRCRAVCQSFIVKQPPAILKCTGKL